MSNSSLKEKIKANVASAMRMGAEGKTRLQTLRLLQAAIKQKEIDSRTILTNSEIESVIVKMIKQRKESITHFSVGQRQDLVDKESNEISILQPYLPTQLDHSEVEKIVNYTIEQLNASTLKDMGRVMQALKPILQGKSDMSLASSRVKERLSVKK